MGHILKRFIDVLESVNFKNVIGVLFILFVIVQVIQFSQSWNQRREAFYEHFAFLKALTSGQVASVQIDDQCEFPAKQMLLANLALARSGCMKHTV